MATNIAELRKAGKMTAKNAGGTTVQQFFESNKSAMSAVLPRHANPERMTRLALSAIRTTPALMQCELNSLMGAVMVSAQLGLEPNTPLGHAYLVPFKRQGKAEVQFIPGYRGLIELARRSGQIVSIGAHVVHEHDEFEFAYGLDERLVHRPALTGRGRMIAVYAVAKLKDGGHQFEVLSAEDVEAVRNQSKAGKSGPWLTHFDEMSRKTAIRRLFKYLPVSIEFSTALHLDAMASEGQAQHLDDALSGEYTVETPTVDDSEPECPEQHRSLLADLRSIRDEHGPEQAAQALADAEGLNDDERALLGDLLKGG